MKISGDMAVKLGIGAAVLVVAYLAYRKAAGLAGGAAQVGSFVAQSLNPANPNNIVNRGVSAAVSAATGREETLGGWLHDLVNPDPMDGFKRPAAGNSSGWDREADSMAYDALGNPIGPYGGGENYTSWYMSDAEANDARRSFAATDPRRLDR